VTFDLTPDQQLLADAVARLLEQPESGRWARFAEMGLLGLPLPETAGGFGGGGVETMVVMEAMGAALAPEPYLSAVMIAAALLAGDDAQLPRVRAAIAGERRWTLATSEPQSRYYLADVTTTATREGDGWTLAGRKLGVLDWGDDVALLVTARTGGTRRDEGGVTLFAVAVDAPGLCVTPRRALDGLRSAEVELQGVRVGDNDRVGPVGQSMPAIRRVVDRALAGACADAVGAMARLLALTVEHLKVRQQFGRPIGSFQALQHRAADMLVEVEQARSMAMYAAAMADETDPAVRRSAVAAAKVQVVQAARFVGQQAIQLHGGIGMSEEHVAGAYFRRLTRFERLFGDEDHFLGEIDRCGGIGRDTLTSREPVQ
jgi:alkylation response protein AidB-like acyl-CoA dehydrogenase